MNVKKLSLASLFLMACSFAFGETSYFVKVTQMSQLVPGNRYVILYNKATGNADDNAAVSTSGKGNAHDIHIQKCLVSSGIQYLIETEINANLKPDAIRLETTDGGYALYSTAANAYLKLKQVGYHELITNGNTAYPWSISSNNDGTFKLSSDNHYLDALHPDQPAEPQWGGSSSGKNFEIYLEYGGGTEDLEQTMITFGRSTAEDATDLNYYATVYYDKDFLLDHNMTAYGITNTFDGPFVGNVEIGLYKWQDPYQMVWAGSPVILKIENNNASAPAKVTYPIYVMNSATTDNTFATGLKGTSAATTFADDSYVYKLGILDNVVGFWKTKSIGAHRAYIEIPAGSEIKSLTFSFNPQTGIEEDIAPQEGNNDDAVYSLVTGQKVNKNHKGIVVNKKGKKILNK